MTVLVSRSCVRACACACVGGGRERGGQGERERERERDLGVRAELSGGVELIERQETS